MFDSVSILFVISDSASLKTPEVVELRVGESYTLKCSQTGRSGEEDVGEDPVFVVQSPGPGGTQTNITEDDTKYFLATGQIKFTSTTSSKERIPIRPYYLGVSDISLQDDGTKYICISESNSRNQNELDDAFQYFSTTLKVKPSKLNQ